MWEVYAMQRPFEGEPLMAVVSQILSEQRRLEIQREWKCAAIMNDCWQLNPEDRPKMGEIEQSLRNLMDYNSYPMTPGPGYVETEGGEPVPDEVLPEITCTE
eukprot:UN25038